MEKANRSVFRTRIYEQRMTTHKWLNIYFSKKPTALEKSPAPMSSRKLVITIRKSERAVV
jgi:hypothetical protein